MTRTVDRAHGRWPEILMEIGVARDFLRNKHGPCPLCGGVDRFRFDDKDGSGSYYCHQCGAGNGLTMIRKKLRLNYADACDRIDKIIGTDEPDRKAQAAVSEQAKAQKRAEKLARIEGIIAEATDREVVEHYLSSRGLSVFPDVLLGHRALPHYRDGQYLGRFPAVVAPILGPNGELQSAQRIYAADVKPRKTILPAVDTITGAAVRLFVPEDGVLGVAEGVETAIAAFEMFGTPTWACLSAGNVEAFRPPSDVRRLVVFGDNDHSYAGQKAAFALANKLGRDIEVSVEIPAEPDNDWLDALNARAHDPPAWRVMA